MEFSGNANYYTPLPSVAAPNIDYPDPASVNDSATFNNCISGYSLSPVMESDFPSFSPPTMDYFSYLDPHQEVTQMGRLNEEVVDPNDSLIPLCNVSDKSMAISMPACYQNSSIVVNSNSEHPITNLMLTRRQVNEKRSYALHPNSIASSMAPNSVATLSMNVTDKDRYPLQTNNNLFISSSFEPKNIESGMPNVVEPVSEYEANGLWNAPSETDMNQVNHQKKRMKADENGGRKQCNCKRSKCLKLYCDCFADGFFCTDSCACQGCSNKSTCVDIVAEARQQIESRNPTAFAPKVVQQYSTSPAINNGDNANLSNPASAKHKRGCNCKNSLCMKKYCECYQGNVGCSFGCRCEGCQNIFGKKEDSKPTKDVAFSQNIIESSNAKQDEQSPNSPFFTPSYLHNGSTFGGNQYASTQSLVSPYESFGISVSTSHQSHMVVASSTWPTLGNSNNLIDPANDGFSSIVSPQLHSTQSPLPPPQPLPPSSEPQPLPPFSEPYGIPVCPYKKLCLQHILSEVMSRSTPRCSDGH